MTYTSTSDTAETDSFTFKVNDGTVDSEVATVSITIIGVNDAPTANAQSVEATEQTETTITLTGSDPDNADLTYEIVTQPTNGTAVLADNVVTYTSTSDTAETDSFTFKVNDGTVDSEVATVSITIIGVNDAPTANAQSVEATEQTETTITLTGSDPDNADLTYEIVTQPTNGTAVLADNVVTYTSTSDTAETDSFTFKVNDGTVDSEVATVSITIIGVNDAPTANAQSVEATEQTETTITLTGSDPDNADLTYEIVTQPTNGTAVLADNVVTYTSTSDTAETDSFTFKVNDGTVDSEVATVSITIIGVNDAPTANAQSVEATEQTETTITLTGSDPDNADLTYEIVTQPTNGTAVLADNVVTYTSTSDTAETDSFTFKVNDGTVDSEVATVSITIIGVNDAPTANAQSVEATEQTETTITLTGSDPDNADLTYEIVTQPTNGTAVLADNVVTYTSTSDTAETDSFTFKVNDGTVDSEVATVSITIIGVNDAPTANAQSVEATEQTETTITLTGSDPDNADLTYEIVTQPTNGTAVLADNVVTYTSTSDTAETDSFTFKVNDGTVDSEVATVSITIIGVNDAPTANAQSVEATEQTETTITLTGSDPDNADLTYEIVTQPTNGTAVLADNVVTYTSTSDTAETDSFTFKVNDGTVDSEVATVSITIIGASLHR